MEDSGAKALAGAKLAIVKVAEATRQRHSLPKRSIQLSDETGGVRLVAITNGTGRQPYTSPRGTLPGTGLASRKGFRHIFAMISRISGLPLRPGHLRSNS